MRIIILFVFFYPIYLFGNPYNPIIIHDGFECVTLSESLYYLEDDGINTDSIIRLDIDSFSIVESEHFSAGVTLSNYWLTFEIDNQSGERMHLKLEIDNPRINFLKIVEEKDDDIFEAKMGDYLPFHKRAIFHRNFIHDLELSKNEKRRVFIHLNKKGEPLNAPIYLWDSEKKIKETDLDNLISGSLIGSIILYIIFLVFYILFVPSRLILYYTLFLFFSVGTFVTERGFGYQYIWSDFPRFQQIAMDLIGGSTIIFWVLFITYFFNVEKRAILKRITIVLIALLVFKLVLSFLYLGNILSFTENVKYFFLAFYNSLNLFTLSFLIYVSYSSLARKRSIDNVILVIAFSITLCSAFIFLSKEKGWLIPCFFVNYSYAIGTVLEIIFVSIVLFLRYKMDVSEKQLLEKSILIQKNTSFQNLLVGQVEERKRLSAELHDGLSIDLALIQHQIANLQNTSVQRDKNRISSELKNVIANVHAFAQDLQPIELDKLGLKEAIEELISRVKDKDQSLEINFNTNLEHSLKVNLSRNIYQIVKELLNNSIKHSKATIADIDLYILNEIIELGFGDDGIGYFPDNNKNGIGLKSIKNRIDVIEGDLRFTQKTTGGVYYKIVIPTS